MLFRVRFVLLLPLHLSSMSLCVGSDQTVTVFCVILGVAPVQYLLV